MTEAVSYQLHLHPHHTAIKKEEKCDYINKTYKMVLIGPCPDQPANQKHFSVTSLFIQQLIMII